MKAIAHPVFHRIMEGWCWKEQLKGHSIQPTCSSRAAYSRLSRWLLSISKEPFKKTVLGHSHPVYCLLLRPDTETNRIITWAHTKKECIHSNWGQSDPTCSYFRQNSIMVVKTQCMYDSILVVFLSRVWDRLWTQEILAQMNERESCHQLQGS